MSEWVQLCAAEQAPEVGKAAEFDAAGVAVCLINVEGALHALDNWCPHRRGPLGQGWVEGSTVVCPWHCWAFDVETGDAAPPENAKVAVFPIVVKDGVLLVNLS